MISCFLHHLLLILTGIIVSCSNDYDKASALMDDAEKHMYDAPEGTPVYAMYDGTFSKTQRYVVEQPNRPRDSKEWPKGYTGDTNGAGNRFSLECEVDGEKMYIMYWHMQAGTPVATNPRTRKTFEPGDEVFAGELIGYTGRTGNAHDSHFYHLHLNIKNSKGECINPEDFINGELQWHDESRKKITETEIINIRCDEEPQKSSIEFLEKMMLQFFICIQRKMILYYVLISV